MVRRHDDHYGSGSGRTARVRFRDAGAEWAVLRNPELAIGEGYMDGRIDFPGDTLLDFLLLVNDNWDAFRKIPFVAGLARLRFLGRRAAQHNTLKRSRRNVAHHYDLDERIYRLFLDPDMQYSCAYFERPGVDLEEAQWAKKRHLASKLALEPGQDVLDIGSGWGGLGLFLSDCADVNVTGVTLSTEQHRVSTQRAEESGLADRVRFELKDYRSLAQRFDRIVSVGMFEHVGATHYVEFFRKAVDLLKDNGVMMLHSIGRFDPPGATSPWITNTSFPAAIFRLCRRCCGRSSASACCVTDIEILRLHYAETLKAWRQRFRAHWRDARAHL